MVVLPKTLIKGLAHNNQRDNSKQKYSAGLQTELWGSTEDHYKTAHFLASTTQSIWPAHLFTKEEEEGRGRRGREERCGPVICKQNRKLTAMYGLQPASLDLAIESTRWPLIPKSHSLMAPFLSSRMLEGFTSARTHTRTHTHTHTRTHTYTHTHNHTHTHTQSHTHTRCAEIFIHCHGQRQT